MTPGAVGGTPTDPSAVMVAHRLLSSTMHSNNNNDWPVQEQSPFINGKAGHIVQKKQISFTAKIKLRKS